MTTPDSAANTGAKPAANAHDLISIDTITTISRTNKPVMARCMLSVAIASSLLLVGCGSDEKITFTDVNPNPDTNVPNVSIPKNINTFKAAEIDAKLAAISSTDSIATPAAKCGVVVEKITYQTKGAAGEPTNATAALMLPSGTSADCQGDRPVLLYAHGTTTEKVYDFTQVGNAENPAASEATSIAANYAAQGYIVVAPNYAGYDTSTLGYHPYLVADQQSGEMVNALDYARATIKQQQKVSDKNYTGVSDSGKLFVTGYSQGGHVAMATARLLEQQNKAVTAVAGSSGPYALAAFGDEIFRGNVNIGASRFAPLLGIGLQEKYGNIYKKKSDIFLAKYAEAQLPSELKFDELVNAGKLPVNALFQDESTNPILNGLSKGSLFSILGGYDEANYLIQTDFRAEYVADTIKNPDGLTAENGNGLPAVSPENNLRKALKDNDLRGYVPTMPTLICGGNQDPTVYYDTNTGAMVKILQAASAQNPAAKINITVLDVDKSNESARPNKSTLTMIGQASMNKWDVNNVVTGVQTNFSNSVKTVKDNATEQGANPLLAFFSSYHGSLVSPACTQATREFFNQEFTKL